jgi:lysophospholipase L1-like esterase
MIKPPKIFLYYVVIAIVFLGLSYLIPEEGVQIGNLQYRIKWLSLKKIVEPKDSVVAISPAINDSIDISTAMDMDSLSTDTLGVLVEEDTTAVTVDEKSRIQYPASFKTLLARFYQEISTASDSGKVIRILHMGDSQIEGDRITRYLRESFQQEFKGSGPGLVPVYDPQKQFPSVWINNKGKWSEHTVYEYPRTIKGHEYGIMGKVATIDSACISSINISKSYIAEPGASNFFKSRLFLKRIQKPLMVTAHIGAQPISKDSLLVDEGLTEINWTFSSSPKQFSLDFESDISPVFLGMSLDSLAGVAVDNIAMRGQSTPRLDKTDTVLYRSMASYLNIGMVILQYGTNMVPTISDEYDFYRNTFLKQLRIIKKMMPDVPVLVIGVGDVGTIKEGEAVSYKHVYKIKEAQKEAAFKAGFAFFDLYEAMGGEGAMLLWVNGHPKLAMSDYTHFNKLGGKKVAHWIYDAIMCDYNNWKKTAIFKN